MPIEIAEGFGGYPGALFYLDRDEKTLSSNAPAGRPFSSAPSVCVTLTPRYLSAPGRAFGSNSKTQFLGQGKPSAYLKTELAQVRAGTSTKPLSYAALYPIVDRPNDDISSVFFDDPTSGDPIVEVPLPGGEGQFRSPITAVVGGQKPKSSLLNIITQVIGLAGGTAAKALFPIPGADLAVVSNIEALLNGATTAFAPETLQQYWIDNAPIAVAANQAAIATADADTLQLPLGTTTFAVFPIGEDDSIASAVAAIAARAGFTFDVDPGGTLIASQGDAICDPNPFADFIYVTYKATVQDSV